MRFSQRFLAPPFCRASCLPKGTLPLETTLPARASRSFLSLVSAQDIRVYLECLRNMHDLSLLGVCEPQDMACLKVDDYGGAAAAIVQLELICAQIPCLPLGLPESGLAVFILLRVEPREPCAVDLFHHIPVEPCHEGHCLKGLTQGKQVTHEREQQQRDTLAWGPEGHLFREGAPAFPCMLILAARPLSLPFPSPGEVPKRNEGLPVFLHRLSAARA